MTRVWFVRDGHGMLRGITLSGHTAAGPSGKDIVCAGVSAIAQTAVNALEGVAHINVHTRVRPGFLSFRLPAGLTARQRHAARVILQSARQGMYDIAMEHPRHLRVLETTDRRCSNASNEFAALCAQKRCGLLAQRPRQPIQAPGTQARGRSARVGR